jgi:hypothetical protein
MRPSIPFNLMFCSRRAPRCRAFNLLANVVGVVERHGWPASTSSLHAVAVDDTSSSRLSPACARAGPGSRPPRPRRPRLLRAALVAVRSLAPWTASSSNVTERAPGPAPARRLAAVLEPQSTTVRHSSCSPSAACASSVSINASSSPTTQTGPRSPPSALAAPGSGMHAPTGWARSMPQLWASSSIPRDPAGPGGSRGRRSVSCAVSCPSPPRLVLTGTVDPSVARDVPRFA